jgi:DNA modification methylase
VLKLIEVSSIVVKPNRQRREFRLGELNELAESIQKFGLFHPIILRRELNDFVLVSGERRLRAVRGIYELGGTFTCSAQPVPPGCIPFLSLNELSELEIEEAELEENTRRVDLTWQERADVTRRLATLRARRAQARGEPPPPVAAIANEVRGSSNGYYQEATRRELLVAGHLDDPEVKGAKTLDEAFKVLKRKEATKENARLAETVGKTFTAQAHQAINGDSLRWLVDCPSDQFDVILTDPPYGIGADEFNDSGVTGRRLGIAGHSYTDDEEYFWRVVNVLGPESFRVAKSQAHLYWFCDIDYFVPVREQLQETGWWVHRTPLIWYKPNALRVPWPEHGPRRSYELILYAVKGKRKVNYVAPDILTFSPDTQLGHGAQKPVALYAELLKRSIRPGDAVLDPFAGSGPLIPAAHELKCRATCVELDPASYGIILKRIEALTLEQELV